MWNTWVRWFERLGRGRTKKEGINKRKKIQKKEKASDLKVQNVGWENLVQDLSGSKAFAEQGRLGKESNVWMQFKIEMRSEGLKGGLCLWRKVNQGGSFDYKKLEIYTIQSDQPWTEQIRDWASLAMVWQSMKEKKLEVSLEIDGRIEHKEIWMGIWNRHTAMSPLDIISQISEKKDSDYVEAWESARFWQNEEWRKNWSAKQWDYLWRFGLKEHQEWMLSSDQKEDLHLPTKQELQPWIEYWFSKRNEAGTTWSEEGVGIEIWIQRWLLAIREHWSVMIEIIGDEIQKQEPHWYKKCMEVFAEHSLMKMTPGQASQRGWLECPQKIKATQQWSQVVVVRMSRGGIWDREPERKKRQADRWKKANEFWEIMNRYWSGVPKAKKVATWALERQKEWEDARMEWEKGVCSSSIQQEDLRPKLESVENEEILVSRHEVERSEGTLKV